MSQCKFIDAQESPMDQMRGKTEGETFMAEGANT
jgi:hypothetical protein